MGLFSTTLSYFLFSGLHFVCFALALTVCGLYGQDLNTANHLAKYADSKWVSAVSPTYTRRPVYAVVVGALSAVTCLVYFVPFVLRVAGIVAAAWSFILFILWIAVFGIFGALFIKENPEGNSDIQRMKSAVWVDLANALLWLISSLAVLGHWWKRRDARSQFTGRAQV
ncbi:hypothetical protein TOPH_07358 [Tolypocladium ophioglossoides CBS 100239]|uniref:MARVEL domain-containing protein n=1 Tax=Tolypocladium ophioglossoides (strain CBS 100239) TaxID=1163406 RepID=A0A0L0N1N8_TOLOC|nr:hypothetical protein TOPH_07358 [Tolypocladium ophioglossoides CBS 100239]